ncbi:uncharacterized protein LOC111373823 [Olea europaea var. sylvestris]|uniref:uncharacterized protein LOC111373823 n=1 Tax=Olea europaea var. sylvestris TaxID=158386 RepID=UPI000C1D7828|nr:uncharacterized protein LOC111373823 [Olea europaea var. sylvestris]
MGQMTNSKSEKEEKSEVELELKLLEALEIYPPAKLRGIHRHFVLYGLTEYMSRSFNRSFTADDVLKLLDRFYNLEMVVRLNYNHSNFYGLKLERHQFVFDEECLRAFETIKVKLITALVIVVPDWD